MGRAVRIPLAPKDPKTHALVVPKRKTCADTGE